LKAIAIDAPLAAPTREAIQSMPYTQIVQLHLEPAIRYWEKDGLPGDMWSDTPLERLFVQRDDATGAPTGLVTAWINGKGCAAFAGKSDADIATLASDTLKRLRPASEGKLSVRKIVRWTDENPLAGGAYMHWAPGQIATLAQGMVAPAGRLFFAGEHFSRTATGMEGAMESADIAVYAITNAAGAKR
jgi:monoamine oxidase